MDRFSERLDKLTPLQRAAYALKEMQAKLDAVERARTEPIAIVGMACRFPGGVDSPRAFWRLLSSGGDAIREVPEDRWDVDGFYDPTPGTPGKTNTRWGGFLDQIDGFDPDFFGISPREALKMDPQQRMLLEMAWEALEDAGQSPARLAREKTGVYVGIIGADYAHVLSQDIVNFDAYAGTGNSHCIASNRLSYLLDLHGPSLSIDTACSSSLVGVHLACQALRGGELDLALAGGVNLMLCPETTIALSQAWMLSPTGRCRTFDAAADGYVRSEGGGMVVLKRLSEALADGDPIWAVIKGSAVNQDGRSNGLTAPNGPAQEAVIAAALRDAGVEPAAVDYVECHGTGTPLGDPIEIQALLAVMGQGRPADRPLMIGSVKTNIGHLEAGAGMAGLIKAVLALKHESIPPHLHLESINPLLAPEGLAAVDIPTSLRPWQRRETARLAGLSSFGFGGTNAHAVLEEAPAASLRPSQEPDRTRHLLALSAKSSAGLSELVGRYQTQLRDDPSVAVADLAYSANTGRAHFEHRLAITADSVEELERHLQEHLDGRTSAAVKAGEVTSKTQPAIAFLFTGQGSQYVGMGRTLFDTQPTFRDALIRCDARLRPVLERPLLSVLYPEPGEASPLDQTAYTQPALFALEYALAEMWRSWGVVPSAVMGHSVGEYAATCVAGAMSLEEGLDLIAERARLMQALPAGGMMAAVRASRDVVDAVIDRCTGRVTIAALNGPQDVVISGPSEDVEAAVATLAAQGISSQRLTTSHAFHSPQLDPMLGPLENAARAVRFAAPQVEVISNLTGRLLEPEALADPAYWSRHARQPVHFAEGMSTLAERGYNAFVEIGPSPVLLGMGRRCLASSEGLWLPSLRNGRGDWETLLESLAALYALGVDVDWTGFDRDYARRRVALPTYPFQRKRFWVGEPRRSQPETELPAYQQGQPAHPLLGRRVRLPIAEVVFESRLRPDRPALLSEHRVLGEVVLSGTAYWEMALAAAENLGGEGWTVEDAALLAPLVLTSTSARTVQTILAPEGGGAASFRIMSIGDEEADSWVTHAVGRLRTRPAVPDDQGVEPAAIRARFSGESFGHDYRTACLNMGSLEPGPAYTWIDEHWEEEGERLGRMRAPAAHDQNEQFRLHPGLLDCGIQLLGATLPGAGKTSRCYIPSGVKRLQIHARPETATWCHATLSRYERDTGTGDFRFYDDSGRLLVEVEGLQIRFVRRDRLRRALGQTEPDWLYELRWRTDADDRSTLPAEAEAAAAAGRWVIVGDPGGLGAAIAGQLLKNGGAGRLIETETSKEELRSLLAQATAPGETPLRGVVYAAGLTPAGAGTNDDGGLQVGSSCGGVLDLIQVLAELGLSRPPRLWLLTQGAQAIVPAEPVQVAQSPLWGLGRVIAVEHPELASVLLDLDPASARADLAKTVVDELVRADREDQVAYRGGRRHVARLTRRGAREATTLSLPDGLPFQLEFSARGELGSLTLRPITRRKPGRGQIEIRVRATGLNFRDVMNVLGLYPGDAGPLGGECAGEITAIGEGVKGFAIGDAVVALAPGSFGSYALTLAEFAVRKPKSLSFAEAATIPIAFLTAHHALNRLGELRAGDRVLIHAASGGVGLAAIQVARKAGAEVFATAGSQEKRDYLKDLGVEHVFDSRNLDFADQISERLGSAGIDLVLNSLTGAAIGKSLALLAPGGRFLELGKTDLWDLEQVERHNPGVFYHTIALDQMMVDDPADVGSMLATVIAKFDAQELQPLPHRVYAIDQAVDAFRLMARARHIGKVVVATEPAEVEAPDHVEFRGDGTYLLTGGLGGLGLRVARWMVDHGARHLVLASRSGATDAAGESLKALEDRGARVVAARCDVSRAEEVERVLAAIDRELPPLAGVVHLAGILDDGVLRQQSRDRFARVLGPKAQGAWNLHKLTADRPLDSFILFSSAASLVGSPGQGNYAAANAFLDALAHLRRAEGRPALALNWGNWAQVGMAAALEKTEGKRWAASGLGWIEPDQGLTTLGQLLATEATQVGVLPVDWPKFFQRIPAGAEPPWLSELAIEARSASEATAKSSAFLERFNAVTPGERLDVLTAFVREQASAVLGVDPSQAPDLRRPLNELGLDSLMAVELCNALGRGIGQHLPPTLLFDYPTLDSLIGYIASEVLLIGTIGPEEAGDPDPDPADTALRAKVLEEVEDLSEAEMDALVSQEIAKLVK